MASQIVHAGLVSAEAIAEVEEGDFLSALPDIDPEVAKGIHKIAVEKAATAA